jgi:hypothetical protein
MIIKINNFFYKKLKNDDFDNIKLLIQNKNELILTTSINIINKNYIQTI